MANLYKTPIRVKVEVAGLSDMLTRLRDLDRKAARKAMRAGVGEVSRLVTREAKRIVRKRSKMLWKSLGRKIRTAKDGSHVYAVVKPRGGPKYRREYKGKMVNPARYAHLVEHGRVSVVPKDKKVLADGTKGVSGLPGQGTIYGTRVKAVPPHPFMRPAWDKYRTEATDIIRRYVVKETAKFWAKSRKKIHSRRR